MKHHFVFKILLVLSFAIVYSCNNQEAKQEKKADSTVSKNTSSTKPLFTLTNKEETGFYFVNAFRESEGLNSLTYEYVYNGGGVAIGDINNDGLPDVLMSGNSFGAGLFFNRGNMQFEDITRSSGVLVGSFVTGVSMVDINNDGYDDIYLCKSVDKHPEKRANVLLINNKDLTFTDRAKEYGLADESYSNHASFFDYDLDGDLDMYLLNHRHDFKVAANLKGHREKYGDVAVFGDTAYEYISDRLYRNNGNGKFTDVTEKAGILNWGYGLSATIGDINQDGYPDIYVANDYSSKDNMYINNGDGTFTDQLENQVFHISKHSMGTDVADFNNDGRPDIMTLDMISEGNYRQKQLKWLSTYDLYHLFTESGLYHQVVRNTLQLNNGDGTFSEIGQLSGISHTDWSWSPLFADFDNDGYKDIFISNGYFRDGNDQDYIKYRSAKVIDAAGGYPNVKKMDLIQQMKSTRIDNYIYKNNGDLTFTKKSSEWGIKKTSFSNGAAFVDLDLDGDLDIITNNFNEEAFLYRNNAKENNLGNNYLRIKLIGSEENPKGIGAKIWIHNGNDIQYIENSPYRGYFSSGEALAHFGLGSAITVEKITVEWPNGKKQSVSQVSANQILELNINEANEPSAKDNTPKETLLRKVNNRFTLNYTHQEDDFVDFKREPLLEHKISNKGPFLAKGDLNGDGTEDFIISASHGLATEVYLQKENGEFNKKSIAAFEADAQYEDAQIELFDLEGDGDLDVYIVSGGYAQTKGSPLYQDRIYLNDGNAQFTKSEASLEGAKVNGTAVATHDFDGDGDVDLFVAGGASAVEYPLHAKSHLWLNEDGKFKNASELLPQKGSLGMINDVKWVDIDNDNKKELFLAGEWMSLRLLKFDGSRFQDISNKAGLGQTSGWWNCITIADLNKDGYQDILIGNRGENSFFKASKEKPAVIYAKDFDENGSMEAIPFYYYNDGKSYPKHSMDEIFTQYPAIRRKFPRYEKFSRATLSEMFSEEQLLGVVKKSVQTFSSAYLLNNGDGTFKFNNLPIQAQFSEVHGILPIDIDEDGNLDLIISGNQYGTDVSQGRSDASIGLVLKGDGNASFTPLNVLESGFKVIGDTRGTYSIQQANGKELVLVLNNSGKASAFQRNIAK